MSLPRVVAAAFCTLACVGVASADISKPFDGVSDLTTRNFKRSVLNGKHWFVEFYAPWCGWCKKLEPEWRTLGRSVGDKHPSVAIGKVNADNDASDVCRHSVPVHSHFLPTHAPSQITDKYDVKGFPTIVFIRPGGQWVCCRTISLTMTQSPPPPPPHSATHQQKKYSGARTASAFLEYINREAGTDLAVEVHTHIHIHARTLPNNTPPPRPRAGQGRGEVCRRHRCRAEADGRQLAERAPQRAARRDDQVLRPVVQPLQVHGERVDPAREGRRLEERRHRR